MLRTVATNRKAKFNYQILETYEAGIVLTGCEIKSIREGKVNFKDSFAQIKEGEVFLFNLHLSPYEQGNRFNPDPTRPRKLLLRKKEIKSLLGKLIQRGWALIPLEIYLKRNLAKVKLALAKGKKVYDKKDELKKRDLEREMRRQLGRRR
jgi:SsrA-binding protein